MDKLFKQACKISLSWTINRYLISNAHGRWDGAEKAQRHIELCKFYTAVFLGLDEDDVEVACSDLFQRIHEVTQELTGSMDTEIGFPLNERPDYDELVPKFFERFHELATSCYN